MFQKIKSVVRAQLRQGATPHGLALSCAFAFVFGVFPVLGATTLLCFLVGTAFKLNQPLMQILNYFLAPFQFILIPIFLKIGEWILNAPAVPIRPTELIALFMADWRQFLSDYGVAGLHAIFAWFLIAPILGVAVYFITRHFFRVLGKRIKN